MIQIKSIIKELQTSVRGYPKALKICIFRNTNKYEKPIAKETETNILTENFEISHFKCDRSILPKSQLEKAIIAASIIQPKIIVKNKSNTNDKMNINVNSFQLPPTKGVIVICDLFMKSFNPNLIQNEI